MGSRLAKVLVKQVPFYICLINTANPELLRVYRMSNRCAIDNVRINIEYAL